MAKFGPKDKTGYDPFNAIAQTLTALKEEPAPVAAPVPQPQRQQQPLPPARPMAEPARPPAERPAPVVMPESSGGVDRIIEPRTPRTVSQASGLRTTKRFKTTRGEALKHDQAAVRLGSKLGISVDFSKVTRALWEIYLQHEDDILKNVPVGENWERPSNNDPVGLAELDERIAQLIGDGFMVAAMRPKNRR